LLIHTLCGERAIDLELAGKSQAFSGNLDADRVERMTNAVSPSMHRGSPLQIPAFPGPENSYLDHRDTFFCNLA